ncbi:MAG TPA: bifunctional UDP-N-acetylglucosamine diphosphorylase/glucosamine-1-phosphate N-acetyltransferase GlmU [Microlunatus sp.]|nr:bifunctional UDP-N-acetylglucosamine diphosphorylase/glucosamine-1-phosphate N-acetyltransferase GlmU [Microlunatus sp.]
MIVLAAGGGTRMKSSRSKLLHEIAGHTMLSYALAAATEIGPDEVVVVVGHQREQVQAHLAEIAPHVRTAVQEQQLGTGHAVQCGLAALADLAQLPPEIVVTYGDVPMLSSETLAELLADHRAQAAAVTVLTAVVGDPTGYGRVVRDQDGHVARIVEHRDADDDTRAITEINSGIYVFDSAVLTAGLGQLDADNDQGELYLTDVLAYARSAGGAVAAHLISDTWQTEGVNDRVQLSAMNAEMNRRILHGWMTAGVTILDPATTWVQASVDLAPDVTLLPGTSLEGATSVGAGATIGPEVTLKDVEVGEGASVVRTHAELSVIGAGAEVGPYARLRPGTRLGTRGKIGTFVETKNAQVGDGAKVPHQTYVGDAEIGREVNVGAGVIFANYDGVTKSTTVVGDYSFVGSNSVLNAPVTIAPGAYVAAGSVITGDVGPGDLGVARGRQRNIPGWVLRKRAGTKTAAAAERATSDSTEPDGASTGEDAEGR